MKQLRVRGERARLEIQIPADMYRAILARAAEEGVSITLYVHDVLASHLSRKKKEVKNHGG